MKTKTIIKALYFSNPKMFGYRSEYPWTVTELYNKLIKHVSVDNTDKIALGDSTKVYVDIYIETIRDNVSDWYKATKKELIK